MTARYLAFGARAPGSEHISGRSSTANYGNVQKSIVAIQVTLDLPNSGLRPEIKGCTEQPKGLNATFVNLPQLCEMESASRGCSCPHGRR